MPLKVCAPAGAVAAGQADLDMAQEARGRGLVSVEEEWAVVAAPAQEDRAAADLAARARPRQAVPACGIPAACPVGGPAGAEGWGLAVLELEPEPGQVAGPGLELAVVAPGLAALEGSGVGLEQVAASGLVAPEVDLVVAAEAQAQELAQGALAGVAGRGLPHLGNG